MPSIDTSSTSRSSRTSSSSPSSAVAGSVGSGAFGSAIVCSPSRLPAAGRTDSKFRHSVPNQAMAAKTAPGRPRTTSRDEVQRVALALFAERGFEATTLDDIAAALGVSRRTLFRYYPSKNDIVWAEFSAHLAGLRERLAGASPDEPLMDVLRPAGLALNDQRAHELPELRIRLSLI